MATEANLQSVTLPAAGDLSGDQYCFVVTGSGGSVNVTSAAGNADGVLQNKPTSGAAATVAYAGVSKVVASAGITRGDAIGSAASGQARTAQSGDYILGRALATASGSGVIIPVLLVRGGVKP